MSTIKESMSEEGYGVSELRRKAERHIGSSRGHGSRK